jgi:CBS domain-containing protein
LIQIKALLLVTQSTTLFYERGDWHMNASDIMVSKVITVGPDTNVRDVARILLDNRISAVPVVSDDGKLVGIISEGDLMRRTEAGTERHRAWWLAMLSSNEGLAAEFVRAHARRVADLMTQKVITANPETSVGDIASLMEKNCIKRVPIVKDGRIVGIVSRANLLQALASAPKKIGAQPKVDDAALREKIQAQLKTKPWSRPSQFNVIVHDGTVELWGIVDSAIEKKAAHILAEEVPGVRSVNDNLVIMPIVAGY